MLGKYFETPFEMYRSIADFLKNKNLIFKPMSLRQSFDIIYSFASGFIDDKDLQGFGKMLLTDYFSSNKTDLPPESLKGLWKPERSLSSKSGDIMKSCSIDDFKAHRLRIIDDEIYIFNVSEPDPVTGRFGYVKVADKI